MAYGKPAIAYSRGSMPKVIADGVSGTLVPDEAGVVDAVERLGVLDRTTVHAHAERSSVARMVDAYLRAYHAVLASAAAM